MSTASDTTLRTESLTTLHWVGAVLAVITGVLHLVLGVSFISEPLGWSFLAAGVGFLGGVAALLVDYRRRLLYLLGIPFTAGQIVAWYVVNAPDFSTLGYVDKLVQVLLIVVLVVLYRQAAA
ncbi:hypothetical protein [Halolamina sp.]|jgi:peptidoglycan/LPS O-acetylase OafA/YrhL|uniref:DUF7475 family protein n=1 Tax=Halolamina sp. TaxID=1940283 RepID=UPI00356A8AFD